MGTDLSVKQSTIIRQLKGLEPAAPRRIPILDEERRVQGALRPVDGRCSQDDAIVASLTAWRKLYAENFFTQFEPTIERTRRWLQEIVLPNDTRLLCLLLDPAGTPIGNYGICNITESAAELDNFIRGEHGGGKQFAFYADIALTAWALRRLALQRVSLRVFSHNKRTIQLHQSVGFSITRTTRVYRRQLGNELHYVEQPTEDAVPAEVSVLEMDVERRQFFAWHPWALELPLDEEETGP